MILRDFIYQLFWTASCTVREAILLRTVSDVPGKDAVFHDIEISAC
jgi:hypothetical protein